MNWSYPFVSYNCLKGSEYQHRGGTVQQDSRIRHPADKTKGTAGRLRIKQADSKTNEAWTPASTNGGLNHGRL